MAGRAGLQGQSRTLARCASRKQNPLAIPTISKLTLKLPDTLSESWSTIAETKILRSPRPAHSRPKLVEFDHFLANIGLGHICPQTGQLGNALVELKQSWANVGPQWPDSARVWRKAARFNLSRNSAAGARTWGQAMDNFGNRKAFRWVTLAGIECRATARPTPRAKWVGLSPARMRCGTHRASALRHGAAPAWSPTPVPIATCTNACAGYGGEARHRGCWRGEVNMMYSRRPWHRHNPCDCHSPWRPQPMRSPQPVRTQPAGPSQPTTSPPEGPRNQ